MIKEVKIPTEIKNYKERFILNLTLRQTISFVLGFIAMVPLYIVCVFTYKLGHELTGWLIILLGVPIMAVGFVSYKNMTLEKFVLQIIKTSFIYPAKRPYKTSPMREEYYNEFIKNKKGRFENKIQEGQARDPKISTGYFAD